MVNGERSDSRVRAPRARPVSEQRGAHDGPGRFRMRSRARGFIKAVVVHGQAAVWAARGARFVPGVRILYYHRVAHGDDQLAVSPARFRRQLDLIADSGLQVVDLTGLLESALPPERTAVVITFDDGYRDFLDHALPALEARGWPATVFIVPGAIDGTVRFPWYRAQQEVLSWDEMRAVERGGLIRFEPHTLTHPDLTALDATEAWREIYGSKEAVEQAFGRPARSFCYPGGFFGPREAELAAKAGFEIAVGCEYGVNRPPFDAYALRRILVDRYDTSRLFAARLRGATDRPPLGRRRRQSRQLPTG